VTGLRGPFVGFGEEGMRRELGTPLL